MNTDPLHGIKVLFAFLLALLLVTDALVLVGAVAALAISLSLLVIGVEFLPLGNLLVVVLVSLLGAPLLSKLFIDSTKNFHPSLRYK